MPSAVLDTVVYVRCLLNPRSVWGRLLFGRAGRYRLIVSAPLLAEIRDVLDRPKLAARFRFVAGLDKRYLLELLDEAETVEVEPAAILPIARDPKDDKVLATARAAKAEFLVTEDEDLLVLGSYEGTRIVGAVTFSTLRDQGHMGGEMTSSPTWRFSSRTGAG